MYFRNQTYKTEGGHDARIYATDGEGKFSLHGAIQNEDGGWEEATWTPEGCFNEFRPTRFDLAARSQEKNYWILIYLDINGEAVALIQEHKQKIEADERSVANSGLTIVACFKKRIRK